MKTHSVLYRIVASLVSLALLMQIAVPVLAVPYLATSDPVPVAAQENVAGETAVRAKRSPEPLTSPLTISRIQSRYQTGGDVTITYQVYNNLPPTLAPEIAVGTSITDTVGILSTIVLTDDMNTLRQVVVTSTLTAAATYVGSSQPPVQNGNTFSWQLGDLLPGDTAVLTMTVQPPAAAPDFTNLDTGALVAAALWDGTAADAARPALVAPDAVAAETLQATLDADLADGDMLWETAVFDQDPVAAFRLVQEMRYDPYKGSLRGTRGTLWGEAGNSLDQSSLLIAMLRAAGIPARYRHGTLLAPKTQAVLASMFDGRPGVAGYLPAGTATADPLNDPALIALAQDHWWVEAYLPGSGWTDLDPTVPGANLGNVFATPGPNDRIAEIPDSLRHKVTLQLEVEQYTSFPIGGLNLTTFVPLTGTYSTAQVASKAVILGHVVTTDVPPGLVFTSVQHTYTPYFGINGDELVTTGDTFDDLLTTFPLASYFTTAEWITIEVTDVDGISQTYRREVKDIIGQGVRLLGGVPTISSPANNEPFITFQDSFVTYILPNALRNTSYADRQEARLHRDLLMLAQDIDALPRQDLSTPEVNEQADEARLQSELLRAQLFGLTGLEFARRADPMADRLQENLGVKLYYDQPRVIMMQGSSVAGSAARTVDLRNTTARAIAAPGQDPAATRTAQWAKAVAESTFEGEALRDVNGLTPVTTARIFEEAKLQGIDFVYVTPDRLDLLELYLPDPAAYGYAAAALIAGKEVLIPQSPVLIDGAMRLGWWEIDPVTGTAVSVLDDGTHGALVEYATMLKKIVKEIKKTWEDFGESVHQLWFDCIVDNVVPALQGGSRNRIPACLDGWSPPSPSRSLESTTQPWFYLPDHLCPIDNCGVEQFVLDGYPVANIPLPEMSFQHMRDGLTPATYAGQVIAVTDSGGGGAPSFTLSPSGPGTLIPMEVYGLDIAASANFNGDLEVWTYVPDGWSVGFQGSSQVQIVAPEGTPAGNYTILVVGQSAADRQVMATAQHVVTVPVQSVLELAYGVESNITVPMTPPQETAVSNQTNDGEAEIPDSAFRLDLFNKSSVTETIDLSVTGAPAGWVVLNGREQVTSTVTLAPYNRTRIGLYVVPPSLPAPGTSFTMDVTAGDSSGNSDSVAIPWSMPGPAFNYLVIVPEKLYVEPFGSEDLILQMTNVGNAAGAFPITATIPVSTWSVSNIQTPVSLASSATDVQTATLTIGDAPLGSRYPLQFASTAPGSYTQYAFAEVQIVSPESGAIFEVANSCTLGDDALAASLEALALAVVELEYWCDVGDCPLPLRDNVVAAANSAAGYVDAVTGTTLTTPDAIRSVAATLATHTDDADILADVAALSTAVANLGVDLCEVEEHRVSARYTPFLDAILLGDTASFSLTVSNLGTVTTTYAITVARSEGNLLFNETIPAGADRVLAVNTTPAAFGAYDLDTDVAATGPDVQRNISAQTTARLNVVDKFVQVTAVAANPPFVETGTSSTNLSVDVVNVAGVAQTANAAVAIIAPGGSAVYSSSVPLSILIGVPRNYALGTVNTSGWSTGVYTITVDLQDGSGAPIPEGSGYGFLTVGQGIVAEHAALPPVVAPGAVTVTTVITTAIGEQTIGSPPPNLPPEHNGRAPAAAAVPLSPDADPAAIAATLIEADRPTDDRLPITDHGSDVPHPATPLSIPGVYTRTEQDASGVVYTGTWQTTGNSRASGGNWRHSRTAGHAASFAFSGPWVSVGFIGDPASGEAELFIDGISQGIVDTYRRDFTPFSVQFTGLADTNHVISMTVLDTASPKSNGTLVRLDYFDVWNGTPPADGSFEESDPRVILSTGAVIFNDAIASGGSYARGAMTAWFPFYGDSFSYQAIAYAFAGDTQLYLDGQLLTTVDLFAWTPITRTFSFTGLASGLHVLQVTSYRDNATLDLLQTPGTAPFTDPAPPPGDFNRYEEDHPDFLYNGSPYLFTDRTWTRTDNAFSGHASGSQYMQSVTAGDVASLTFSGSWASIGFATGRNAGTAEIFIDGASQGVVDLYRREDGVASFTFPGIGAGTHTISVTVLGPDGVYFDYIDVWNGTALPNGTFDWEDGRYYISGGWGRTANAAARGGDYLSTSTGHAWFPFNGDSVSFESFASSSLRTLRLYVDDKYAGSYDLSGSGVTTPTLSLDGLGGGMHVLRVDAYRGSTNLNAFRTPGTAPFIQPPPPPSGFTRIEEDDTGWLYNGVPFTATATTWTRVDNVFSDGASNGQYIWSSTPGDTAVYTINGTSFGVGLYGVDSGGHAEIYIDGVSYGVIDTYRQETTPVAAYYHGLPNATHTISITVLGTGHPNVNGTPTIYVDFLDVWDGTGLPDGYFEQDDSRILLSDNWGTTTDPAASGGSYYVDGLGGDANLWFPFAGDSVTFQTMGFRNGVRDSVRVFVDGVPQGILNLYNENPITRPISFAGFGPGMHVLTVERYQGETAVDSFATPGTAPFYQPPVFTGIVRYEDDNPALRFNGYTYEQRPGSWSELFRSDMSEGSIVGSSTPGDTASLTFSGSWINLGMRTRSNYGVGEVFIDGVSQGLVTMTAPIEGPVSFQYGGLVTGTHTLSVTVVSGYVPIDYIEVWDGTAMADDFINARMTEQNGRIHFGRSIGTYSDPNAIDGDYSAVTLLNAPGNVWYTFVGDSFTYYAFSRNFGGTADVYIDGVYTTTVDIAYDFTNTPLAFHFTGLPYGPHAVRIVNGLNMRVDGFAANPQSLAPYQPLVEWFDNTGAGNGAPLAGTFGVISTIAAGDVDGDGDVELAATADDLVNFGTLFLYEGDGSDTGDGDPIIWSVPIGSGFSTRANLGMPTMAELDGTPGAEIVVAANQGLFAFNHDGTQYWHEPTLSANLARGNPAIGNLDLDAEPEIVVNMDDKLAIYEADGTLSWQTTFAAEVGLPLLSDLTGDGLLDILFVDWDQTIYLYDYNLGTPQLVQTAVLSTSLFGLFGAPAIADIDGQQPGGDAGPEIAVTSDGLLTILDADLSILQEIPLDPGVPGGVSIADVDGDGEVEMVTGVRYDDGIGQGRIYVVNADGSILWFAPAYDSTSANSQSVLDLDGDGVYEIAWNGKEQGLTIFNGADGSIIYNDPLVNSHTATDYPNIADVDNDGYAEVIVPTLKGIRVVGHDRAWANSRPVWNQHSYHITNINDDLSVPFSELNSWEVHNTYRTQTPLRNPAPSYGVVVTHTAAVTGVTVLTNTFNVTPTMQAIPDVRWDYQQDIAQRVITRTFVSELANVQPGEVRKVAEGTEVVYSVASGQNRLLLPPLYVSAPRIVALAPQTEIAYGGTTAVYTVTLSNPAPAPDTYTLSVAGIPAAWATLSSSVLVPASGSVIVPLTVTVPADAAVEIRPVIVDVMNGSGGSDSATAFLSVGNGVDAAVTPVWQTTVTGQPLTYTLTITNNEGFPVTYALTATGLAAVSLPATFMVAGMRDSLTFRATPLAEGPQPFTIQVTSENGPTDSANGVAEGNGRYGVTAALVPDTAVTGPGVTTPLTLTVTNLGTLPDTYDLTVTAPPGWGTSLQGQVTLQTGPFNAAELLLLVSPVGGVIPGSYPVTVTVQSQQSPAYTAVTAATLVVDNRGVAIDITPPSQTSLPTNPVSWQVTVTNTGSVADTYDLVAAGGVAAGVTFATNPVMLNPGQAQTVQVTASGLETLLPRTYRLTVAAVSRNDSQIAAQAEAELTLQAYEAVAVDWLPATRVVSGTLQSGLTLLVTNTGNVETRFNVLVNVSPAAVAVATLASIYIPAHGTADLFVRLSAPIAGTYTLTGTAVSLSGSASAAAAGTVTFLAFGNQAPTVDAGPDQTVGLNEVVQFNGSATDPDGDSLASIVWDFGDGNGDSGTLSPTHTFMAPGTYIVTLTVMDEVGNVSSDTLTVTVDGGLLFIPIIFKVP